jgi:hypothetical protein
LTDVSDIAQGTGVVKTGLGIVKEIESLLDKLKPYKPEMKTMTVDYRDCSSKLKLVMRIPDGIKRDIRYVEIPAYSGYKIEEVYDDSFNKIKINWVELNGKWVANPHEFGKAEKFLVAMKGSISKDALNELVSLQVPRDPKRDKEIETYWLHSAIKDMSALEKLYDDLLIEKVNISVKVGVERAFTSSIPQEIKDMLEARRKFMDAVTVRDRNKEFKTGRALQHAEREAGKVTIAKIQDIIGGLISGDVFAGYVKADNPYLVDAISPTTTLSLIPDQINVGVSTDLRFDRPAAQGNLTFEYAKFSGFC